MIMAENKLISSTFYAIYPDANGDADIETILSMQCIS